MTEGVITFSDNVLITFVRISCRGRIAEINRNQITL